MRLGAFHFHDNIHQQKSESKADSRRHQSLLSTFHRCGKAAPPSNSCSKVMPSTFIAKYIQAESPNLSLLPSPHDAPNAGRNESITPSHRFSLHHHPFLITAGHTWSRALQIHRLDSPSPLCTLPNQVAEILSCDLTLTLHLHGVLFLPTQLLDRML